ncbi:hypothetical protein [Geodermatophilus sabuli]|uniref:Uncharacterized protein n=1 Tax=Geodermatophilus sabuli TaxID=1564158 RepID=A0A285EAK7_9ACTN|nr:hypothetical protein [Geodermatophilus sabuli]MBB3081873.1 hypothetical protein [Geodermatophilus sabuli]SNX95254.1 hypothetical protein SAMN06893097_1011062 [Geodermatophilus sabuli]
MSEPPETPSLSAPSTTPVAAGAGSAGPGSGPTGGPAGPPGPPPTAEVPGTPPAPGAEGHQPTAPVTGRPRVGARRPDPMTRMGPWAPAAAALLGLLAGVLVVLLLRGSADAFHEQLALVFLTVGLGMLGAAAALLADEVRLVRRGAREAAVRPAWVETTAGLLNGLTPARLLMLASAFVLFLAAYVSRG